MGCRWTQVNYINLVDCISFFIVLWRTPMTMKITSTTTSTNRKLCSTPFPFSTSHTDQSIRRVLHLQHSFFFFYSFFSVHFLFFWDEFQQKMSSGWGFFFFGLGCALGLRLKYPNLMKPKSALGGKVWRMAGTAKTHFECYLLTVEKTNSNYIIWCWSISNHASIGVENPL